GRPEAAGDDLRRRGAPPPGRHRPGHPHAPPRHAGRRPLRPVPRPPRRPRRARRRRPARRRRRGPRPARPRHPGGRMTPLLRRAGKGPVPLAERLDALERAAAALDGVAPAGALEETRTLLDRVDRRRALSAEHTVIGLFGATGSGKSSLVNALVGTDITRAAVRRPTTSAPVAAVLGAPGSEALLDWLEVEDRHLLDGTDAALARAAASPSRGRRARRETTPPGIILLDLPDLDSVE